MSHINIQKNKAVVYLGHFSYFKHHIFLAYDKFVQFCVTGSITIIFVAVEEAEESPGSY